MQRHLLLIPMSVVHRLAATALTMAALVLIGTLSQARMAHAANPGAPTAQGVGPVDKNWQLLSTQEKTILAPLASQWPGMNEQVRDKWRTVARSYSQLPPDAQARVRERMKQWSQASPKERSEARLRFQNARELPHEARQQKWQAYQALSPQTKAELAQQAQRKKAPVPLAASQAGPREAAQAAANKASNSSANLTHKANVVPSAALSTPATQAVAPALVKAGQGATTSLVTQSTPKPPLHQQTGMPKIAATKTFVDPKTLLPKKGSQGAAMTPVSAPNPAISD
jgi:Protein of unknown function (DUF3106)